jgi:hypothetical protein
MSYGTKAKSLQCQMLTDTRRLEFRERKSEVRDQTSAIPHPSALRVGASTICNLRSTDCKVSGGGETALFLGQIAPYKVLEYLIDAFSEFSGEASPLPNAMRARGAEPLQLRTD